MIDTEGWHRADIATEAAMLAEGVSYLTAVDGDGVRYIAPLGTRSPGVPVETVWAHGARRPVRHMCHGDCTPRTCDKCRQDICATATTHWCLPPSERD